MSENKNAQVYDPWEEMRQVTLPRHSKNEQNFQWVSVNDRHFQIPRDGQSHDVPLPIYEVIMHSRAMADFAADRSEAMMAELKRSAKESEQEV
ncbi:MAG: hypothetical protein IJJ88_01660 [Oscillospiraceae bacterium]|nr:hypothetical protein [Oscillospiraceae bacterium]